MYDIVIVYCSILIIKLFQKWEWNCFKTDKAVGANCFCGSIVWGTNLFGVAAGNFTTAVFYGFFLLRNFTTAVFCGFFLLRNFITVVLRFCFY